MVFRYGTEMGNGIEKSDDTWVEQRGFYLQYCKNISKKLNGEVEDADVIILASPIYVYHVTGAMKAFLDYYGWCWVVHRPREKMFSKQAVYISIDASAGMKSTNQDMAHSIFLRVAKTYRFGFAVMETSWEGISSKKKLLHSWVFDKRKFL